MTASQDNYGFGPQHYNVTAVRQGDHDFEFILDGEHGTPLAYVVMNDWGQWNFQPCDSFGQPDPDQETHIDIGNIDIEGKFRQERETIARLDGAAFDAAYAELTGRLKSYRDETFDIAVGIAKRRARALEW